MRSILDFIKVFKNIETYKGPGPRNMAQGGRIGYDDGQLVRPTVAGSRPGYQGPPRAVLGDPVTIDGNIYKKVLNKENPNFGKYVIREGTNNPRMYVKKSEIKKTVKENLEIGKMNLEKMFETRAKEFE